MHHDYVFAVTCVLYCECVCGEIVGSAAVDQIKTARCSIVRSLCHCLEISRIIPAI